MELWLVRDVPSWLVGALLVLGLPAVMLGLDALIHKAMPHRRLGRHNLVTGVMVSVVGVAYGIMIGMCVVSLWDGLSEAEHTTRAEAANLAALVPASRIFGAETEQRLVDEVVRYHRDVADGWRLRTDGKSDGAVSADLGRVAALVGSLQPTTGAQEAFVQDAVNRVGVGQQLRQESLFAAKDQQMSSVMWLGVSCATGAILALMLLFGLDDGVLRRILISLASVVIATNLFLIVQMNYPYYGSFAVGPSSFEQVVQDLTGPQN